MISTYRKAKAIKVEAGLMKKIILSMGAGLIDDFIRNILSVPFCPCHFVHTILSNAILSVYHFVHTILSVPFCPLPYCPRTRYISNLTRFFQSSRTELHLIQPEVRPTFFIRRRLPSSSQKKLPQLSSSRRQ